MFCKKKKSRLELLKEAVGSHAHDVLESAHGVLNHASEAVHERLEHAPERIGDLKGSAEETLGEAFSRVQGAVSTLGSTLGTTAGAVRKGVRNKTSHATDEASQRLEDARHQLDDARHQLEKRLAKTHRRAQDEKEKIVRAHVPEVVINDGGDKWIWLGVGILVGAIIGILMAPSSGRRNRALIRDKIAKGAHQAGGLGEAASRKAHDLSNRVEGVAHKVADKINTKVNGDSDDADDVTIADRVRTAFGRLDAAQGLERINIDSVDGLVTLRGPIVSEATAVALIAAAAQVAGVREVVSDLIVEDESEETFVG